MLPYLAIIAGIALLVWSADRFIDSASKVSTILGLSPLLIGMLVVGFGTSAPKMVVSFFAALDGNSNLALGNALGSNITNILLILGVTAIIAPITVHSKIIFKEIPILFGIGLLSGFFYWDGTVTRVESIILLAGFVGLVLWSITTSRKEKNDPLEVEMEGEIQSTERGLPYHIIWLITGLVLLVVSSRVLVWAAVNIATSMGVSELVIGLTIVALGTSLPELAASIVSARKGEHEIAVGNVVGSNMFNLLAVVGIAGSTNPIIVEKAVLIRDWPVMMGVTLALFLFCLGKSTRISKMEGALMIIGFVVYTVILFI